MCLVGEFVAYQHVVVRMPAVDNPQKDGGKMKRLMLAPIPVILLLTGVSTSGCSSADCELIVSEALDAVSTMRVTACVAAEARADFDANEISFEEMKGILARTAEMSNEASEKIQTQVSECPDAGIDIVNASAAAGARPC